jgi:hypothetical protein
MRACHKYGLLLACLVPFLAAPTCQEAPTQAERRELRDRRLEELDAAGNDLRSEVLSARNLRAFESRATEKLVDYADYLSIVYDKSAEQAFRELARQNISQLFVGGIAPPAPVPPQIQPARYNSLQFMVDSVEILKPLIKEPTETYRGSIRYTLQILGVTASDTLLLESAAREMEMVLQMGYKDFGDKSLLVWEVLLKDG